MLEKDVLNTSLGQHHILRPAWVIDDPAKKKAEGGRGKKRRRMKEKEGKMKMKRRRIHP